MNKQRKLVVITILFMFWSSGFWEISGRVSCKSIWVFKWSSEKANDSIDWRTWSSFWRLNKTFEWFYFKGGELSNFTVQEVVFLPNVVHYLLFIRQMFF